MEITLAKYEFEAGGTLALANEIRLNAQRPWLDRLPDDIKTILDVGAGCGVHSKYFLERGYIPTAVDLNDADFLFHNEIEFIKGNLLDLPPDRKFDAIFLSHVIEHFPNLERGLNHLRGLLNDGGYLCLVVPPYEPIVCDNHWQTGWNCGQLATTLAACGFDCSTASFLETAQNVCGWGRKISHFVSNQYTDSSFDIELCQSRLPVAMQGSIYRSEAGNVHIPDLIACNDRIATRRLKKSTFSVPEFRLTDGRTLRFPNSASYRELSILLRTPLDLTHNVLRIISLCEKATANLRVAVSSDADDKNTNIGEYWLDNSTGSACSEVSDFSFKTISGHVHYDSIKWISIGGMGSSCVARIWAYLEHESILDQTSEDSVPDHTSKDDALRASQLFFYRNKTVLLEQEKQQWDQRLEQEKQQWDQRFSEAAATIDELRQSLAQSQATLQQITADIGSTADYPYRIARGYRRLPPGVRKFTRSLVLPPLSFAARLRRFLLRAH
ncbi:hypothetical protein UB46_03530 [Burkholderiaceae bacterium 16]|nr:hypothetical protein UB46_03530 [Burkholderiaceae bacterium 16]